MFGITKSTSELTAVAQTPECRYHLGLGINNVQVAVNSMDGDKRSHLLSLCGQLLKQVLTPCHIAIEASQWIRTTALSYAAEMDGHVLGTLCAVTMALLTNRLDLCIQGLFWSWQIQIHGDPYPCPPRARRRSQTQDSFPLQRKTQAPAPLRTSCSGLTRQRRCLSDSGDWLVTKKGTNPAIPIRNSTSTQENQDRCLESVNWSWPQVAQSAKISPCSGQP